MADTTTPFLGLTQPEVGASSGTWGAKINADLTTLDNAAARPRTQFNSPVVGATTTLDLDLGRTFVFTVTGVTTIAFANVPGATVISQLTLLITNGGAFAVTWPASVSWLNGAAPVLRSSGVNIVELVSRDGGTTWYGEGAYPRCKVFHSANQATVSAIILQLAWDSETIDIGALHDPVTNNPRITIPAAGNGGLWLLTATIQWADVVTTGIRKVSIRNQAGTTLATTQDAAEVGDMSTSVTVLVNNPSTGDWFDVTAFQNSGGGVNVLAGETVSFFQAIKLA